jgi:glutamine cyclotransferase
MYRSVSTKTPHGPSAQDVEGLGAYGKAVANGIAYDPAGGRLFVTGKNWPRLFEIRLRN